MKTITLAVTVLMSLASCRQVPTGHHGPMPHRERIVSEITNTLQRQAQAWTDNDLDGFMAGYSRSGSLRFAHPKGVTLGWDTVRERYSRSIAKSRLEFSDLDVTVLAPDAAVVFGRFHNFETSGVYHTGLFTLLMRKVEGKWKAVHDHSSDLPETWKYEDGLYPSS